ncbi:MAG: hypothetical protein B7Z79_13070 [Thiomonas sp. 20-64-9]|nr:MAG: hypothetical protein B7Z79_13070 [Thiomonas sp. 20-64-9]
MIIVKRWAIFHLVLQGKRRVFGQFNGDEDFSLSESIFAFDPVEMVITTDDCVQYKLEGPTEDHPLMVMLMSDNPKDTCLDVSTQYMNMGFDDHFEE